MRPDPSEAAPEQAASRIASVGVIACVLAVVAFLLGTMDRGFSWTDEGFYFLSAQHPRDVTMWPNSAHYYTSLLFHLGGGNVVGFRVVSLLALLGSAVALGLGFEALLRAASWRRQEDRWASLLAVGFIVAGQLAYYAWFLRGASYNLLAALASNLLLGLLFRLLSLSPDAFRADRSRRASLLGIGALLALLFFCKPPSFFGVSFCVAAVLGAAPAFRGARLRSGLAILGGIAGELLCHFVFFESPGVWLQVFRDGFHLFLFTPDYDPHRFWRYADAVIQAFRLALVSGKWFLCAALIGFFAVKKLPFPDPFRHRLLGAGIGGLFLLSAASRLRHHQFDVPMENPSAAIVSLCLLWLTLGGSVAFFCLLYSGGNRREEAPGRQENPALLLAAALCFLVPLADVVGTNRPLTMTLAWYLAPWFALLLLILTWIARRVRSSVACSLPVLLLTLAVAATLCRAAWGTPYRMAASLPRQEVPTVIGFPASTVRLDAPTSTFVTQLREAARSHGFVPGADVINLGHTPELIFFLGGRSPGLPFWPSAFPAYSDFLRFVFSRIPPERLRQAFILQQADMTAAPLEGSGLGLRFPDDYILCGTFFYPANHQMISLWKPR